MAETIFQTLSEFFARYGYWVIFLGVMLENGGVPVPGETVLLFAGFLAYQQGNVSLTRAIVTAVAGATIGDSLGYCLGRLGGTAFVEKYRRRLFFLARQFDRAQALFLEHCQWAVFAARFITGLRIFSGILAGVFRMSYPRFLFFNFTGAAVWATTIVSVGFLFGSSWEGIVHIVKKFDEAILVGLAAGALVFVFRRYRRRRIPPAP